MSTTHLFLVYMMCRVFISFIIMMCRVSDAGIRHVIENAPGGILRELNATNCIKISDVTLLRMSQR